MKKCLFIIEDIVEMQKALSLANLLKNNGYQCDSLSYGFENKSDIFANIIRIADSVNKKKIKLKILDFVKEVRDKKKFKIMHLISYFELTFFLKKFNLGSYHYVFKTFAIEDFVKTFNFSNYNIVIFSSTNIEYQSELFLNKIRNQGLNALIFSSYISTTEEPFLAYCNKKEFIPNKTELNHIKSINPKWIMKIGNKTLFRLPYYTILLYEKLGISGIDPWVGDYSKDVPIFVENEFHKNHYTSLNVPDNQIFISSSIENDYLFNYKAQKTKILKDLNLDANKKTIVFAPPMPHDLLKSSEFTTMKQVQDFIFQSIASKMGKDWQCIVVPHPRENFSVIENLCKKYNFYFFTDGTAKAIGLADAFIATISATQKWALTINIPIINYDFYNLNYPTFKNTIVKEVNTKKDFLFVLDEVIANAPRSEQCEKVELFEVNLLKIMKKYEK